MPAASSSQRQANLDRLRGSLTPHCPPGPVRQEAATTWAKRLPLTHSTNLKWLDSILTAGALISQNTLGIRVGKAETMLDTGNDVFLYVGAFTYPGTECGFLFLPSLENVPPAQGVATPFDSGAMAYKVPAPTPYPDGPAFVRDHELSVPAYRTLLGQVIADISPSPEHFIRDPSPRCHCGKVLLHPLGLPLDNARRNTFEVRLPSQVPLQPPHLRAVFVREGYEPRALHTLMDRGVHIESFASDDSNIFDAMRESCINFLLDNFKS